jgi:hypothetical protein
VNPHALTLARSLLYEGYALYPYTPGSAKNATPTPFGIVYPPAYALAAPTTFDRARIEGVLDAPPEAGIEAEVLFLVASGERHEAKEQRIALPALGVGILAAEPARSEAEHGGIRARACLSAEAVAEGLWRIGLEVENLTNVPESAALDRPGALLLSMLSTQLLVGTTAGRFVSPLERAGALGAAVAECDSVNSFPVLATESDDALLGAPIVLPDHPRIAPESRVDLFDNTEIEEALLLHVHALSEGERAQLEHGDPAVREMIERAAATTPEDIIALHGRLEDVTSAVPEFAEPATGVGHPNAGEPQVTINGKTIRKGSAVVLRPASNGDVYDRMLAGQTARVERIYYDYEGQVHVGVTIDGDPGQELFSETGRYHFFRDDEVEPQ